MDEKSFALLLLFISVFFFFCFSIITSIVLTVIGHLCGWKKIKLPRFLFVPLGPPYKKSVELLSDCCTHPQVLLFIFQDFLKLLTLTSIAIYICVSGFFLIIDSWIIWIVNLIIYSLSIVRFAIVYKIEEKKYKQYIVNNKNEKRQ